MHRSGAGCTDGFLMHIDLKPLLITPRLFLCLSLMGEKCRFFTLTALRFCPCSLLMCSVQGEKKNYPQYFCVIAMMLT